MRMLCPWCLSLSVPFLLDFPAGHDVLKVTEHSNPKAMVILGGSFIDATFEMGKFVHDCFVATTVLT